MKAIQDQTMSTPPSPTSSKNAGWKKFIPLAVLLGGLGVAFSQGWHT